MKTPPAPGEDDVRPEMTQDGLHDAVAEQEHVMTTHLAVIQGWLEMLQDDTLDATQRRRAAAVARERSEALRLDLSALLRAIKAGICPRQG